MSGLLKDLLVRIPDGTPLVGKSLSQAFVLEDGQRVSVVIEWPEAWCALLSVRQAGSVPCSDPYVCCLHSEQFHADRRAKAEG